MNDSSIVARTKILAINKGDKYSFSLLDALTQLVNNHYIIENEEGFYREILKIDKPGDLALYYNSKQQLIGFTHLERRAISLNDKPVTVFLTNTYHDQRLNPNFAAAKFSLTQMMKHKLAHPHEEAFCIFNANTPIRYQFIRSISDTVYPRKGVRIPEQILKLVKELKEVNHWASHPAHAMIISKQLPLRYKPSISRDEPDEFYNYYRAINPGFKDGNCLLACMPLTIATISEGLKRMVAQPLLVDW